LIARHNAEQGTVQKSVTGSPETKRFVRKPVDTLSLAKFLVKIPKAVPLDREKAVELGWAAMQVYTGSHRPNAWSEPVGAGVHVRLLPESESSNGRLAILTGTDYYTKVVYQKLTSSKLADLPRTNVGPFHPDDLRSINSLATFYRFVKRLTNHLFNRNVEKWLYGDYHQYAADVLCWMFTNPKTSLYASTVALNRALIFFHHCPELLRAAELLYAEGKKRMLVQNVSTMNLRLSFALSHNLNHMATTTAKDMLDFKIRPSSRTWALLYAALEAPEQRKDLLELIRRRYIGIKPNAWSQMASATLQEQLKRDGNDRGKFAANVAQLDKVFGLAWFDIATVHQALKICNRQKLWNIADYLAELTRTRNIAGTKSTGVYYFGLLRHRKDINKAVDTMVTTGYKSGDLYHMWIIPHLFMAAWERNRMNLCHLLWIYAATRGLITKFMRTLVMKALFSNVPTMRRVDDMSSSQLRRWAWRRMAARVICGIDEEAISIGTDFGQRFPQLHAYVSEHRNKSERLPVAELLTIWTPDDGTRAEQITLAQLMMDQDINLWKKSEEMSLDELQRQLPAALGRDQRWAPLKKMDELVRKDAYEVRKESRSALEACFPAKADAELSERVRRKRDIVLRNLETAGLRPKTQLGPNQLLAEEQTLESVRR
jgi:hypothetical protein